MNGRKRITALFITAAMALGSLPLTVFAAASGAEDREKELGAHIDYSDGTGIYKEIAAADLLRTATGITVTPAEKEYFTICDITLRYSDNVPAGSVSYQKTGDGCLITASPYSYNAQNGETVSWIPKSVTVNGAKKTFADDTYEALFTGLSDEEPFEILTEYAASVTVPKPVLTALANAGYEEGKRVIDEKKAYGDSLTAYETARESYESEYSAYLDKSNGYRAYLRALARYNAEKAEYDAYIAAKEKYENDCAAWLSYADAYEAYERELADFEVKNAYYTEQYSLYAESYAERDACRESMEVLNSIFVRDSAGHAMYNTLKGNTVAEVVSRKNELVEYGVNEEYIDNAGDATNRLTAVLTPYSALKTESERFSYYRENYGEISSQFTRLFSALYSLANTALVRMELQKREKLERYYQFVAQLYVISAGLDDNVTFSDEWNVRGICAADVLESVQIVEDKNASDPTGHEYPVNVELPEKPVRPGEPEKPDKPQFDYTEEIPEPSAPPAAVDEPDEPEKPLGKRPDAPVFTSHQTALENGINDSTLKKRAFGTPQPLTLKTTVSRTAVPSSYVFVSFCDHDGKTPLYGEMIPAGGDVSYNGKTPEREADGKNTYVFSGWVDENGDPASFTDIRSDRVFRAAYTAAQIGYNVTFELNGETAVAEFVYGDRPICPVEAVPYVENGVEYIFDGWSPSLSLVTDDAVYTAVYKPARSVVYTVGFVDHDGTVITENAYRFGDVVAVPADPVREDDGEYTYTFKGWDKEITAVTGDTTYKAVYERKEINPEYAPGDVNRDGAVNNKDVVALFKAVSVGDPVYDIIRDFNGDGAVNNKDVAALFKYVSLH